MPTEVVNMKTLVLFALVFAVLFMGILGVFALWEAGLIDVLTTVYISGTLGILLVFSPIGFLVAIAIRRVRAGVKREEQEMVEVGQCMNCGGGLGYHHWTCKRHRKVEVFCSERCYYEHLRNAHRQRQ